MKIAIGVTTRRRPQAFGRLLESLKALEVPVGADLVFLICENDSVGNAEKAVEGFRATVDAEVLYEREPTKGIPFGRNRVLEMARREGSDFLLFLDDDEMVPEDWLKAMIAGVEAKKLDLAGGPLVPKLPEGRVSKIGRALFEEMVRRQPRSLPVVTHHVPGAEDGVLNICTNNWCLRMEVAEKYRLSFDPAYAECGGEDVAFGYNLHLAGGRLGWISEAIVYDVISPQRLSVIYQYRRTRDLALAGTRERNLSWVDVLRIVVSRSLETLLLIAVWPLFFLFGGSRHWKVWAKIVRKAAIVSGRIGGKIGMQSRHYSENMVRFHEERIRNS